MHVRCQQVRNAHAGPDTDDTADDTQGHRFRQKLQQDVAPTRANRHADAYLAGPFRDAH